MNVNHDDKDAKRQQNKNKKRTSSTSSSSSLSSMADPPPAPDGGWGWMVVFASFMIHLIADGVTYTFGIFYFELLQYFSSGKGLTAWIPSIMTGMTFAIGMCYRIVFISLLFFVYDQSLLSERSNLAN